MENSEQRHLPRHRGKLPVSLENGEGLTRDFNISGIYFETERSFSPGQPIEFSILLKHVDPACPVRLKCLGEIIRVDESGPNIGVAASITSYSLEELTGPEPGRCAAESPKRGEHA